MPFCPNCGKEVSEDTKFCPKCGHQLKRAQEVTYSRALRWISGVFGFLSIVGATTGLEYFAESGLVSELIVDIVSIAIGIFLLLMSIIPHWVSSTFKIKLWRVSTFATIVVILILADLIAVALGPEPPGGWWRYG